MAGFYSITVLLIIFLMFPAEAFPERQQPSWIELKSYQQEILRPLEQNWETMDSIQKKKWLKITRYYLKKTPQEQDRIQSQMKSWSMITSEQRDQARKRFGEIEKLPAVKRRGVLQKWHNTDEMMENAID